MAIPQLTPAQLFQNSVNGVPITINRSLNPANQQGITWFYTANYNAIFANANGSPADALTNLGVGAANILNILSGLYTFLSAAGVTGISAVPAYTANSDGSASLVPVATPAPTPAPTPDPSATPAPTSAPSS